MTDPIRPIIHSEQQKSFHELRSEFREQHRQRISRTLREDTITFRDAAGNYLRDKDGNVIRRKTGYLTDAPAGQDFRRVDEWQAAGGAVPEFSDDFIIPGDPTRLSINEPDAGLVRELRDLSRDAASMAQADSVKHPDAPSLEGPALDSLDEAALLEYLERMVQDE